jgi:hypothetical protein
MSIIIHILLELSQKDDTILGYTIYVKIYIRIYQRIP